jgi:hypothetical protein
MGANPVPAIQKSFPLDPAILGPGSAVSIGVSAATSSDVLMAIVKDTPFPERELALGSIDVGVSTDTITLQAGPGTVGFQASAGVSTGFGVFNSGAAALQSLQLDAPPALDLSISAPAGARFISAVFRYRAAGQFTGSQPIGAVGTLTFGAKASASGLYAMLHRFAPDAGAAKVLGNAVASLRLPRHVAKADSLAPGTWVIGECDGSLALQIAASVGYDVNFVRKANLLNITRQLSAKIDASVKATFGFSISGRYLVVAGREDDSGNIHLRLYKQAQNGITFGLNAEVGVKFDPGLPGNLDDFVSTVFGVNALQVMNDLREWTDPNTDLGQKAARLIQSGAEDLIQTVTGKNPQTELAAGHQILMDAIGKWHSLPDRVSSTLSGIIRRLDDPGAAGLKGSIAALADPDDKVRSAELANILQNPTFGNTPQGKYLESIAERGVLALFNQSALVQKISAKALEVLGDGVIPKLQEYIDDKLNLQKVLDAADPAHLNAWIQKRLGDFLDKELDLAALKEVQAAIRAVLDHAQTIYATALKAATNRYSAQFAVTYQRTVTGEALVDAVFNMAESRAAGLLAAIMEGGSLNELFTAETPGVSINQASMSHGISRDATVAVHLPYFDSKTEHINESVASVTVEHDAGRVLVYQVQSTDKISKKRFLSQMQVFGRIVDGTISGDSTISYQMLMAKSKMELAELKFRTRPFIDRHLSGLFAAGGAASIDSFYAGLDRTVEDLVHNGPNEFGNVLLNLQVALPGSLLQAWIAPLTAAELRTATMNMSRVLQARLRSLVPLFYFQDLDHLVANPVAAALLTWAAMPLSTSVEYDFETKHISKLDSEKSVYWNWPDQGLRKAMAGLTVTQTGLVPLLASAQERLTQAGLAKRARDFDPKLASGFQTMAIADETAGGGLTRLSALCQVEAVLVGNATKALQKLQDATSRRNTDPAVAIESLADAGSKLCETFNNALSGIYGGDASRSLNGMLLVEATNAIRRTAVDDRALLNLIVLNEDSAYDTTKYLTGDVPGKSEIALTQSLVSA